MNMRGMKHRRDATTVFRALLWAPDKWDLMDFDDDRGSLEYEDPDDTCPACGGDGMDDDVTPCGYCGGDGHKWWRA